MREFVITCIFAEATTELLDNTTQPCVLHITKYYMDKGKVCRRWLDCFCHYVRRTPTMETEQQEAVDEWAFMRRCDQSMPTKATLIQNCRLPVPIYVVYVVGYGKLRVYFV